MALPKTKSDNPTPSSADIHHTPVSTPVTAAAVSGGGDDNVVSSTTTEEMITNEAVAADTAAHENKIAASAASQRAEADSVSADVPKDSVDALKQEPADASAGGSVSAAAADDGNVAQPNAAQPQV